MARAKKRSAREQLRELLDKVGWNQATLARELSVHEAVVSRILSGQHGPSLRTAFQIEDRLGLDARAWAEDEPTSSRRVS